MKFKMKVNMKVKTILTWQEMTGRDNSGQTLIVIDVLRATSTITAALAAGAEKVIPQNSIEGALAAAQKYPNALLCGERKGVRIEGFHLGNSPLEFKPETVGGKVLICTTTNGTNAIFAAKGGRPIYLGCLNNAWACAEAAFDVGQDLTILCAGTRGNQSVDDMLAAGSMVYRLQQFYPNADYDPISIQVKQHYEKERHDLHRALIASSHGQFLAKLSMSEDIAYCAKENIIDRVPLCENGEVCFS